VQDVGSSDGCFLILKTLINMNRYISRMLASLFWVHPVWKHGPGSMQPGAAAPMMSTLNTRTGTLGMIYHHVHHHRRIMTTGPVPGKESSSPSPSTLLPLSPSAPAWSRVLILQELQPARTLPCSPALSRLAEDTLQLKLSPLTPHVSDLLPPSLSPSL
jgi:hypothetical protein